MPYRIIQKDAGVNIRLVDYASHANSNFDQLTFAVLRYAKENGIENNSIVLKMVAGDTK
jgi:hypothetical protein